MIAVALRFHSFSFRFWNLASFHVASNCISTIHHPSSTCFYWSSSHLYSLEVSHPVLDTNSIACLVLMTRYVLSILLTLALWSYTSELITNHDGSIPDVQSNKVCVTESQWTSILNLRPFFGASLCFSRCTKILFRADSSSKSVRVDRLGNLEVWEAETTESASEGVHDLVCVSWCTRSKKITHPKVWTPFPAQERVSG